MKNSPNKKHPSKSNMAHSQAAQTQQPTTAMTVETALTYFDFSQSPPAPIATHGNLDSTFVQYIGETILDGITDAFLKNDTPTFVKCYQALHFCLGLDMESHRMNFGPNGKVAFLMTAYQTAVLFNHVDMATALFDACLASPHHPIREGISAPIPMITHAYSMGVKRGSAQDEANWLIAVDYMIKEFVDRLTVVGPDDLCPTTSMIFALRGTLSPGHDHDAIDRLCIAMQNRYTLLVSQGSNNPPDSDSKGNRL